MTVPLGRKSLRPMRNPRYVIAVPDLEKSPRFCRDVPGSVVHEIGDPGWRFLVCGQCVIIAGECSRDTGAA